VSVNRQTDPRIAELSLENRFDFFPQGFAQPFSMVLLTTPFQLNHLKVKRTRISEIALPGEGLTRAASRANSKRIPQKNL
jgi:hypothetical protein